MIRTKGAFLRDPLYNMLQLRQVDVSAGMRYVLSREDIASKSAEEITEIVRGLFSFDYFREQQQERIMITEPFRADGLNRVLYKCPACKAEGKMQGKGITLRCTGCGKTWQLTEDGFLKAEEGGDDFRHIPDWYRWERECVREELESGEHQCGSVVQGAGEDGQQLVIRHGPGELCVQAENRPIGFAQGGEPVLVGRHMKAR